MEGRIVGQERATVPDDVFELCLGQALSAAEVGSCKACPFHPCAQEIRPLHPYEAKVRPLHPCAVEDRPLHPRELEVRPFHSRAPEARPLHLCEPQVRPSHPCADEDSVDEGNPPGHGATQIGVS